VILLTKLNWNYRSNFEIGCDGFCGDIGDHLIGTRRRKCREVFRCKFRNPMFPSLKSWVTPSSPVRSRWSSLKLFLRHLCWAFDQPAESHNEFSQKYSLIDPRIDICRFNDSNASKLGYNFLFIDAIHFIVLSISFSHSTVIQKIPVLQHFVFF
jgi:hypothetical protein